MSRTNWDKYLEGVNDHPAPGSSEPVYRAEENVHPFFQSPVDPIDKPLNDVEQHVMRTMLGDASGCKKPGSFTTYLIYAIAFADMSNCGKLAKEYPELVRAVKAYQNGNLYQRLEWQEHQKTVRIKKIGTGG